MFLVSLHAVAQNNVSQQSGTRQRGIQYVEPQKEQKNENIVFFQGISASVDVAGAIMYAIANYGQLEGQLRVNLKNKYFPVFEAGLGYSDHTDNETELHFKTQSPYFRIGCDINFNKNKTSKNKILGGLRYCYTACQFDLEGNDMTDPIWGTPVPFRFTNLKTNVSWLELSIGLETPIYKNLYMGWSARYRSRISQDKPQVGEAWYVPGFGKNGSHNIGATFQITFSL